MGGRDDALDPEALRRDIVYDATLPGGAYRFSTTWGLFSPKGVDEGSRLLLEQIEIGPRDRTLDLGCGCGVIGLDAARRAPEGWALLVDKDFVAVEYARRNAEANGIANAESRLSNGCSHVPEREFDNVFSNLPAKVGNELLALFVLDARDRLRPGGQLVVVTISALRDHMKRLFREVLGNYEKVKQGKTHTVSRAFREG